MDKLDQPLDELVAKSGGRTGKAERAGGGRRRDTPYENTAGRRHLQGASLDDIAAAPPTERCAARAAGRLSRAAVDAQATFPHSVSGARTPSSTRAHQLQRVRRMIAHAAPSNHHRANPACRGPHRAQRAQGERQHTGEDAGGASALMTSPRRCRTAALVARRRRRRHRRCMRRALLLDALPPAFPRRCAPCAALTPVAVERRRRRPPPRLRRAPSAT